MVKKYISKRLQNRNRRLQDYHNTKSIDNTVQTSVEHLTPTTTTEKKYMKMTIILTLQVIILLNCLQK